MIFFRVMATAVYKKTTNLKLHFFSNHPEIANMNKEEAESCQVDEDFDSEDHSKENGHQNGHQREENRVCKEKGC